MRRLDKTSKAAALQIKIAAIELAPLGAKNAINADVVFAHEETKPLQMPVGADCDHDPGEAAQHSCQRAEHE